MTIFAEKIITQPEMHLIGKASEVKGQSKVQFQTVRTIWKAFNAQVHSIPNRLEKESWHKYGISYNQQPGDHFTYMAAVTVSSFGDIPEGLQWKTIPALAYAHFCHQGDFRNLAATIYDIYNKWLPDSEFHLIPGWQCGISHYERYDQGFRWSSADSEIDIFLPIRPKV